MAGHSTLSSPSAPISSDMACGAARRLRLILHILLILCCFSYSSPRLRASHQEPPARATIAEVFPVKTIMPKLKTHKGASKRFKKTGTGKVVRNHAFGRHILTSKPHKRKKKLHQSVVADAADQPVLKRMLPY